MGCAKEEWNNQCCCNCKFQVRIYKHPLNKESFTKGSILDKIGYGCLFPESIGKVVFMDRRHGLCEVWKKKKAAGNESKIRR